MNMTKASESQPVPTKGKHCHNCIFLARYVHLIGIGGQERLISECPICGEDVYFDDDDEMTICPKCGIWLDIDDNGNMTRSEIQG